MDKLEIPHDRALQILNQISIWMADGCTLRALNPERPIITALHGDYYLANLTVTGHGCNGVALSSSDGPPLFAPPEQGPPADIPAPVQIAPGHNPDNLTPLEVGENHKLLRRDEIRERKYSSNQIQYWTDNSSWSPYPQCGSLKNRTYRVPLNWVDLEPDAPITLPAPFEEGGQHNGDGLSSHALFDKSFSIRRDVLNLTMVQWEIADSLNLTSITPRDWIQAIGGRGGFLTALLTDEESEFVRVVYLPNAGGMARELAAQGSDNSNDING